MNFINSLLPTITHFQYLSYWIILAIAIIESLPFVGLVIPGSIFLILLGFLSGQGYFEIADLGWIVFAGSVFGDLLSFWLGSKGTRWIKSDNRYLLKGEGYLKNHGTKSILLGRFIGPLRPIIAVAAGVLKMKIKKFLFWDIISAILWTIAYLAVGYFFGQAWQIAAVWSTRLGLALLVLGIFIILVFFIKRLVINYGTPVWQFLHSIGRSIKVATLADPNIKKLLNRFPRFFKFISHRLNRESFFGLPLTLLVLAFAYVFAVFFGVVEDVINSEQIVAADLRIENLFYAFRHPLLVKFFLAVTLLGKSTIILAAVAILTIILWLLRKHKQIIGLWLTIGGAAASAFIGKILIHRVRPLGVGVYTEDSFSFPSGHATMSMAFYGFIIYLYWLSGKSRTQKINAFFIGVLLISLIGFSRLYLGVHYFSDVAGGWLLGLLWVLIGVSATESLIRSKFTFKIPAAPKVNFKFVTAVLISILVIFYGLTVYTFKIPAQAPQPTQEINLIENDPLVIFDKFSEPKYSETLTGTKQEPISFVIVADNDQKFIEAFTQAGWKLADQITPSSILAMAKKAFLNESYPTAPMTPSFWNAEIHDFGFERPTAQTTIRQRHHARFWITHAQTPDGKHVYVGTASLDIGLKWFIAHQISPAIDVERDLLFNDLKSAGVIATSEQKQFVESALGKNAAGDQFFTDGKVYVIVLK